MVVAIKVKKREVQCKNSTHTITITGCGSFEEIEAFIKKATVENSGVIHKDKDCTVWRYVKE